MKDSATTIARLSLRAEAIAATERATQAEAKLARIRAMAASEEPFVVSLACIDNILHAPAAAPSGPPKRPGYYGPKGGLRNPHH